MKTRIKKRGKKKESFLTNQYSESWKFIKDSKNFIWFGIIIFFMFALFGFFIPIPDELKKELLNFLKQILESTKDFTTSHEWIFFIFKNNILSAFLSMILGIGFGIYPLLASLANGYMVGFVGNMAVASDGFSALLRLIPHGIFELPAIFISIGIGMRFGMFLFRKNKKESFKDYISNSLRVFIFVVIPLLIIAAIIEGSLIWLELR